MSRRQRRNCWTSRVGVKALEVINDDCITSATDIEDKCFVSAIEHSKWAVIDAAQRILMHVMPDKNVICQTKIQKWGADVMSDFCLLAWNARSGPRSGIRCQMRPHKFR